MTEKKWCPPNSFDMHSDIPIDVSIRRMSGETNVLVERHLPRIVEGGLGGTVLIVGGDEVSWDVYNTGDPMMATLLVLDGIISEIENARDQMIIAKEGVSFQGAYKENKIVTVLGIEGASPIGKNLSILRTFYRLGVRLVGLTWNEKNDVASGIGDGDQAEGLTEFGEQFVKEMNQLGMIIDVTHLAPYGIEDVLAISKDPIIASHSNSRSMCNHPRNISDVHVKGIAERAGLIGVVGFPALIGENPSIESIVDHIEYLIHLVGEDSVGLGLDFIDYAIEIFEPLLSSSTVNYGSNLTYPTGIENVTKVKDILFALHRRGFSDRQIEKVASKNFERVFKAVVNKK